VGQYLADWGYLAKSNFWSRCWRAVAIQATKVKRAFTSIKYLRFILSQRYPAVVLHLLLIVFFIWLGIYVPNRWQQYEREQLESFSERKGIVEQLKLESQ